MPPRRSISEEALLPVTAFEDSSVLTTAAVTSTSVATTNRRATAATRLDATTLTSANGSKMGRSVAQQMDDEMDKGKSKQRHGNLNKFYHLAACVVLVLFISVWAGSRSSGKADDISFPTYTYTHIPKKQPAADVRMTNSRSKDNIRIALDSVATGSGGGASALANKEAAAGPDGVTIPSGFDAILGRALKHMQNCQSIQTEQRNVPFTGFDTRSELPFHNDTVASLPSFGIVPAIQSYFANKRTGNKPGNTADAEAEADAVWPTCQMPPVHECSERQLTVIFMAYNPDRLGITLKEIKKLLNPAMFHNLVHEIILVWNGERHVDESSDGVALLEYAQQHPIRIVYPLKMGFPNDLMNRYHPHVVQPTTKALLYYDDDGPFYSYEAIQGGFELWKRHARAQIGAMARQITYSARQQQEQLDKLGVDASTSTTTSSSSSRKKRGLEKSIPADHQFVSHCTNVDDAVDYQFRFFANYDANMVLPSGSLLHANYLCYLWHPALAEIRKFVLLHPVRPDDMTVSMIVSQLAGVAPRVYSRRLDKKADDDTRSAKKRRLSIHNTTGSLGRFVTEHHDVDGDDDDGLLEQEQGIVPHWAQLEQQRHRSLMFSICWDCGSGMTEMKQYWAELRTEAVNSLVRYFGSLNSGSMGWCAVDSPYYNAAKDGRCDPVMAKQGWLPWMKPDGTPKDTCP